MFNYESPLFVSIVLFTIYALVGVALVVTLWSAVRSWRQHSESANAHRVPARRIALLTAGGLVVTLAVTWLLGSTRPLTINGKTYSDSFWLRASDMMIGTALVLIAVLVVVVAISYIVGLKGKEKTE